MDHAGAGFAPPERKTAQRREAGEVRRKISLNGFGDGEAKRQDIFVSLRGTDNRYLEFLRASPYALVEINLSPKLDPNPGDSWILYKPDETSDWKYGTPEEIRGLKKIAGVGARVDIRKWYYDKYSSGKIVAMVAHELGVHIVPYLDEMMSKLPPEAGAPVNAKYIDENKTAGRRGITDHVRVATPSHVDFELYQGVVKDMMAALIKDEPTGAGQAKADDLADAYLLDLSTFAKSGARLKTPLDAGAIATKYNAYRKATGLQKNVPEKSASQVWAAYSLLYGRILPEVAKAYPKASTAALITLFLVIYLLYWLFGLGKALLLG